jgi:sialidase-1
MIKAIKSCRLLAGMILAAGVASAQVPEASGEAAVPLFANHDQAFYRLPSLLVTGKGTVLAAGQKRIGSNGDFAPSSLVLRRSSDGGRTFGPEQTLFERSGACTFNGNLVEDRQRATLFACFIAFPQAERTTWFQQHWMPQGGGFSLVKSTDDGQTWSAPVEVMPLTNSAGWHGGGAFNNNHGIQLQHGPHAGRLVICGRAFKPGVYEGRSKGGLLLSDDHGATWRVGGVMLAGASACNGEVTVGETAAGEVYVNSRNEASKTGAKAKPGVTADKLPAGIVPHQRIFALSRDGGETFYAEGCHAELFDGPCNAGQTWVPDGAGGLRGGLLFTAPAVRQRTQLTGYLSRDGGRTWTAGRVISEKAGGYSDVAALPDQTLLSLYENQRDGSKPRGLLLARYTLAWLLGEK